MASLIDATIESVVLQGLNVSAREIAARANVNHGLVHTYFGSKEELLAQALRELGDRAAREANPQGFPPPDLATRRNGELASAVARVILDSDENMFTELPVTTAWRKAFQQSEPDLTVEEINERITISATLALGWALFSKHFTHVMNLNESQIEKINHRINHMVAEIGGIPQETE